MEPVLPPSKLSQATLTFKAQLYDRSIIRIHLEYYPFLFFCLPAKICAPCILADHTFENLSVSSSSWMPPGCASAALRRKNYIQQVHKIIRADQLRLRQKPNERITSSFYRVCDQPGSCEHCALIIKANADKKKGKTIVFLTTILQVDNSS